MPIRLTVEQTVLNRVDDRLFGQFLERAAPAEPGIENGLIPGTHELQPQVRKLLQQMHIPVLRFPGGTTVETTDWTNMIDNVPGREVTRPVLVEGNARITHEFGVDECLNLSDELGAATILVVNFRDALTKKKPLQTAALHAAGLISYACTPAGGAIPDGMPDWAAVRARNGHKAPYRVAYVEIGNEWWAFYHDVTTALGTDDPKVMAAWYRDCLQAYVAAIRAVAPDVAFIVDAPHDGPEHDFHTQLIHDPWVRQNIRYLSPHIYAPGAWAKVTRDGKPVPVTTIPPRDIWQALVAMPGAFSPEGENIAFGQRIDELANLGYAVCTTEWNWNGWGDTKLPFDVQQASALGAASFLNGLMRDGDRIALATQSMLVGSVWGVTAIRVDPTKKIPARLFPTGLVTALYSQFHGTSRYALRHDPLPWYTQPYRFPWGDDVPGPAVAYLDAVATGDDKTLYLHLINRSYDESCQVQIDVSAFKPADAPAIHHLILGGNAADGSTASMHLTEQKIPHEAGIIRIELPARTVSLVEVRLVDAIIIR